MRDATTIQLQHVVNLYFPAPMTPSDVTFQKITMESLEVTWSPSPSAKEYEIILKNETATVSTEMVVEATKMYSSLSSGTVYKVTIRARNDGGWSIASMEKPQITGLIRYHMLFV